MRRSVVRGSSIRIAIEVHREKLPGASREPQDNGDVREETFCSVDACSIRNSGAVAGTAKSAANTGAIRLGIGKRWIVQRQRRKRRRYEQRLGFWPRVSAAVSAGSRESLSRKRLDRRNRNVHACAVHVPRTRRSQQLHPLRCSPRCDFAWRFFPRRWRTGIASGT